MNSFTSAKNIVDFYIEKLNDDIENKEAHFASQYASLLLLKLKTESIKDSLMSYGIETE